MKKPVLVLMDIDNTIYHYQTSHSIALASMKELWEKYQLGHFDILYEKAKLLVKKHIDKFASSHSRLLYAQKMLELKGHAQRLDWALELENVYWTAFIKNTNLFPNVRTWLKLLKKHSIPVVFVTDLTARIQFEKIKGWELLSLFDAIVTSEESGYDKPFPLIFEMACAKVGFSGNGDIWMIGDSVSKDMEGASKFNAVTLWKRNGSAHTMHSNISASFDSFADLIELIDIGSSGGIIWNH